MTAGQLICGGFADRCNATNSVPQTSEKPESKNVRSPRVSEGGRRKKGADVESTSSREDIRALRLKKVRHLSLLRVYQNIGGGRKVMNPMSHYSKEALFDSGNCCIVLLDYLSF